jgi:hypothetical protein
MTNHGQRNSALGALYFHHPALHIIPEIDFSRPWTVTHKRSSTVTVKEIDGQYLVLDRQRGQLHELNSTASFVWEACNGERSLDDIAAELAEIYEIDLAIARRDVELAVQQFVSCGLLDGSA